ncbi:uncharacterized protein LOC133914945 isoform X2 [Phragmites australis]|uniref:uncharacterized protein LOC133914945 isoform X2 n=1 Tax=Phragmites australis TaxID=29695 RepID=UPI002D77B957|nr:uncharacterized protein LOC133914945 isoform X2 [Phragmites australis]
MEYMVAPVQGHAYNTSVPDQPRHPPPAAPVSQRTRGSAMMQQHRRLALEQEVAELKKHLSDEQTVHDILERALQPSSARSVVLNIPAFIPKKAKELLAELVLVEEEIARLESQIHKMKGGLSAMQQERAASYRLQPQSQASNGNGTSAATNKGSPRQSSDDAQPQPRAVAPEIKSMFFISQAMDGEYLKRHLSGADDKVKSRKERGAMSPKHNIFGLPPRNSHDKSDRTPNASSHDLPIMKSPTKMDDHKIQPNKLSERIVKCLVCIFIRLLRSSRVAELEKSGNLARSGNLQGSFSFRIDTGLSLSVAAKEKERGQQDHYGIFGIQDAIVRDIGPYKNLVRFTSSSFDLRGFSSSPLLTKLREMLEALQQVDLRSLSHQQKLAFWLNIYNTCIMHGILQHGLPSNSEKLLALKNKATINVSGQKLNALVIENFILRQPSSVKEEFWKCDVDVEEQQVRGLYGLNSSEPNILFALCCGIRSSPALRIYKADRVITDLEKAKLEYLQASLVVTSTRRLMIPSLIHSNMHDFAKDMESLVRWICEQLPTSWSLRKSMVDCLRGQIRHKMEEVVDVIPFDYEFQYLLPM